MRTTNLKCDRCKREETVDQLHLSKLNLMGVGIAVLDSPHNFYVSVPIASVKNAQEWCEQCRIEVGLVYRTPEAKALAPDPTLEEQLVEVLKNIIRQEQPQ